MEAEVHGGAPPRQGLHEQALVMLCCRAAHRRLHRIQALTLHHVWNGDYIPIMIFLRKAGGPWVQRRCSRWFSAAPRSGAEFQRGKHP